MKMFDQKNNELNQTRNSHLLKIIEELHNLNEHIYESDKINTKLDIIISLLQDDDKILIDISRVLDLIEALDNYFTQLQKNSLCKDNSQELPLGTHEVLNEIEIFKTEFESILSEQEKRNILKSINNMNDGRDSFLQ